MLICSHCQTENRPAANFCLRCGWVTRAECPRCGGDLLAEADYCDHCGLPLSPQAGFQWGSDKSESAGADVSRADSSTAGHAQGELTARPTSRSGENRAAAAPAATPSPADKSPTSNISLARFASRELLDKLETARQTGGMVGERRVVTMLFCDVKGSTAAAEKLDPEDWSEIMNGAFEHMIAPVYTYEGIVARLQGDSILAFFGAPITHEDDPQRAVLAGLDIIAAIKPYQKEIQQRFGIEFGLRVGINTGMVVVGAVGSDLKMEYTALGDAINLAARMEQTAEAGTVQIAHDTYKLIQGLFEFEELGGIEVKGKSEPVLAYRVLGRKAAAIRQRGIEGLHADLVGRETEMQALSGVLAGLVQGVGWLVCIVGEAGVGKSRLIKEAHKAADLRLRSALDWYETGSLSYETNQAYGLFLRLIQQTCEIAFDDSPPEIRSKIGELVDELDENQRPAARRVFEALFAVSSENGKSLLEGDSFKQELHETMQGWWRSRFSTRPAVLVFDDMHWADAASVELLKQLLLLTEELPLALIFSLRPEREAPAWTIKNILEADFRHRTTELTIRPLSETETNELVNRLLAIAELPDALRTGILERSGGNPFFVEEVVRSLIENGVVVSEERIVEGTTKQFWTARGPETGPRGAASFEIPDNLQTLLASRIDRLEDDTRGTLQIASVIGRSFYRRVLQAVDEAERDLDKRIGTLIRVDMIREAARMPELEYAFRNPLTQEAVYNTILHKRRREFHRKVGEAMENLYTERAEVMYGLLAHHFSLAGQPDKAAGYYRLLASQAVSVFAYEEAHKNLRLALELVESRPPDETHLAIWEELGDACRLLRDGMGAIQAYQHALALQDQMVEELPGSTEDSLNPSALLSRLRLNRKIVQAITDMKWTVSQDDFILATDNRADAQASLVASLGALLDGSAQPEFVYSLVALAIDAWRLADPPDWDAAERYAQKAVEVASRMENPLELSQALGALATVLDGRGRLREHLQTARERLEIVQTAEVDDRRQVTEALRALGAALMYVGEYQQAISYLHQAERLAEQIRAIDEQVNSLGLMAQCWLRLDRWDEVLETETLWRDLDQRYTRARVGET